LACFHVELDRETRTVTLPDELTRILRQDRSLLRWYDELNHSTRNDIAKWIAEPKGSEARKRRAEQIAERLLAVMDAERELAPILQVAFARHPQARQGWDAMSASRRRAHLLGIFYYRSPDAQGRRIDKMLDDAAAVAERTPMKATGGEKESREKRNSKKKRAL
jgi:uncharacterized protein YdeI (YjbR/CyaY-like superfamily)